MTQPSGSKLYTAPGGGDEGEWSFPWDLQHCVGAPAFYFTDDVKEAAVMANVKSVVKRRLQQRHRDVLKTPKYKLLRWLDGVHLSPLFQANAEDIRQALPDGRTNLLQFVWAFLPLACETRPGCDTRGDLDRACGPKLEDCKVKYEPFDWRLAARP